MKSGPGLHRDRGHATRFRQPRGEGTAAAAPFAVAPGFRLSSQERASRALSANHRTIDLVDASALKPWYGGKNPMARGSDQTSSFLSQNRTE